MNQKLKKQLLTIAKEKIPSHDVAHDINHALRVLHLAEYIAKKEHADLDIVIPGSLFHDLIVYPKHTKKSEQEADESAEKTSRILSQLLYPKEKIHHVAQAIAQHSFSKGLTPDTLEGKIVQDADRLEATGAISIMRTFAYGGRMKMQFYHSTDPFAKNRKPEAYTYALDLFYNRLLLVGKMMNTKTAKKIANQRTKFLHQFLKQLESELFLQ